MFIVIELQTDKNNSTSALVSPPLTGPEAESRYHTILASAAVSNVYKHAALILDELGEKYNSQYYIHDEIPAEPEE